MTFPKNMTALQACKLSIEHWERMRKYPYGCFDDGESPEPWNCALCAYDHRQTKLKCADDMCGRCPVQCFQEAHPHDVILCGSSTEIEVLYFNAHQAWCRLHDSNSLSVKPLYAWQDAADRVIARLKVVRVWVLEGGMGRASR